MLNRIIIVTGTPGTGKTTVAKEIAEDFDLQYVDVNEIIEEFNLVESYDKKRDAKVIDTKKLSRKLQAIIRQTTKGMVIDSHLSHYIAPKYVNACIVTKCSLKELQKRLQKRGYSKEKVRENLDAEIFDVCLHETRDKKHQNIVVIDTSQPYDIRSMVPWD